MFYVRIEISERTFDIQGEEEMEFLRPCPIEECDGVIFGRRSERITDINDTDLGKVDLGDLSDKERRQIEKEVKRALVAQDDQASCDDCFLRKLDEGQVGI